jgi:serine protease AprX
MLLIMTGCLYGQDSYFYRVYFRDKGENSVSNFTPEQLLSARALQRRHKAGIIAPDIRDIPVSGEYIDQISAAGFTLHCTSKWMNTALFMTQSPDAINVLLGFQFVTDARLVKTPGVKSLYSNKSDILFNNETPPPFDLPVSMLNGQSLHDAGYDGTGMLICILDGGFINADIISSLDDLRGRKGIKSVYNFVQNNRSVYNSSMHGTAVLSVLAGKIDGMIEGTAPGADYLLLLTEDVATEFPCEEDFWAAGAEYADSAGADIISSSLGYFNFDDPAFNYKYSDLDGKTAFITRAAGVAASKGILVVNSAGNERNTPWHYIIFPADGDSVLAAGAVDEYKVIASFSSSGPTADGRIKPDNVAMGVSVPVQVNPGEVSRANGTSFSCPVLSGMAACLMQAVPGARNSDIISTLHSKADRSNSPDSLYGYGIPDMAASLTDLQNRYVQTPVTESIAGPNPSSGDIDITFREQPGHVYLEIINMGGMIMYRKEYNDFAGRTLHITQLQNMAQGIYYIRLRTGTGSSVHKIIRIKN